MIDGSNPSLAMLSFKKSRTRGSVSLKNLEFRLVGPVQEIYGRDLGFLTGNGNRIAPCQAPGAEVFFIDTDGFHQGIERDMMEGGCRDAFPDLLLCFSGAISSSRVGISTPR